MLALGNCMADWVADTVVAKSGNTQMAFASCFGSPMLSHVLGLSVAFAVSSHSKVYSYTSKMEKFFELKETYRDVEKQRKQAQIATGIQSTVCMCHCCTT